METEVSQDEVKRMQLRIETQADLIATQAKRILAMEAEIFDLRCHIVKNLPAYQRRQGAQAAPDSLW